MKPTVLVIMDGYGLSKKRKGNAIDGTTSPFVKYLYKNYPSTTLDASGLAVGLPDGQMGNSEVGHLNLGAGRVVYQDLSIVFTTIKLFADTTETTRFLSKFMQSIELLD